MVKYEQVFLKPCDGCLVRDPLTRQPLAAKGELKPLNTYWLRRLRMKDAYKSKPEKETKETKEGKSSEAKKSEKGKSK